MCKKRYIFMYWTGNIEIMSIHMWIWLLNLWYISLSNERSNMTEWTLKYFPPHSNTMTSCSPAENDSCSVATFFFFTTVWWYSILYQASHFFNFKGKPTQCQLRPLTVNANLKNQRCLLSNFVWYWASKISANILFLIIHFQSFTIYDGIPITRRHHTFSTCDSFRIIIW